MTKVDNLTSRLNKVGGSNVWIPPWLADVGSADELAEWRNLNSYRGPNRYDRILAFVHAMRKKYGDRMPLSLEEELERGSQALKENVALRRHEGISAEMEAGDEDRQE
jgi:hypothetical protein